MFLSVFCIVMLLTGESLSAPMDSPPPDDEDVLMRHSIDAVEVIRKHLEWTRREKSDDGLQSFDANKFKIYDEFDNLVTGPVGGYCQSSLKSLEAQCCFNMSCSFSGIKIPIEGCAKAAIMTTPRKALQVTADFDGYSIVNATLQLNAPSPICMDIKAASLCAVFSKVSFLSGFHGCVDLDVTFLTYEKRVASKCW